MSRTSTLLPTSTVATCPVDRATSSTATSTATPTAEAPTTGARP